MAEEKWYVFTWIHSNQINFIENTGVSIDDREFGISLEDYYGGSFLLAWDRTPDKCNRFHRHAMDSGSIDINIKLGSALNKLLV